MKPIFVPLSSSSLPKAQKTFIPKVLPPAESSPSDASIAPAASPSPAAAHATHGQASIELKREGGNVVGITVRCACGQVIEIECVI